MRTPWHPDEVMFLREMTAMRFTAQEIARLLDRTKFSITDKRRAMGIRFPKAPPKPTPPRYRVADIKALVARHFKIEPTALTAKLHAREFSRPRHVAWLIARQVARKSLPDIGRMFERDHTTVLSGIRSISRAAENDSELRKKIKKIRALVEANPLGKNNIAGTSSFIFETEA